MTRRRRAVILPVVLAILLVLGVLAAGYAFRVQADLASTHAMKNRMQTRFAAEAGVERVKQLLRTGRLDMSVWYHNPEQFNRIIVWSPEVDRTDIGTYKELDEGAFAFRFSIVADDLTDDEKFVRFGLTDEASKINLNLASEKQLLMLVEAAVEGNQEIVAQDIVNAILDWRDADSDPRGDDETTEGAFYEKLERQPYRVKNGPFDSVEELLLVKGITPEILYGEDFDRNGLLTENEDDGDETFPLDDQNGRLNLGLAPYLTVHSYEANVANNNRPRVYLLADAGAVREELGFIFEDEPEVADQVMALVASLNPQNSGDGGQGGGGQPNTFGGGPALGGDGSIRGGAASGDGSLGGGAPSGDGSLGGRGSNPRRGGGSDASDTGALGPGALGPGAATDLRPNRRDRGGTRQKGIAELGGGKQAVREQARADDSARADSGLPGGGQTDDPQDMDQAALQDALRLAAEEADRAAQGSGGSGGTGGSAQTAGTPAALFLSSADGEGLDLKYLPILMDRTTFLPPQTQKIPGLININTASRLVLSALPGLDAEQVADILSARDGLDAETKATTAWLVTEGILDIEAFVGVAPSITARGQQFIIQSLGYADHIGMVTRLEVMVDMSGPLAQIIYYRDVTALGGSFPIREKDMENLRAG